MNCSLANKNQRKKVNSYYEFRQIITIKIQMYIEISKWKPLQNKLKKQHENMKNDYIIIQVMS